ncbi:50S ribosomal protein L27 [archaeon]|nr:MAG: 50S ribosomal protein L27 [archaeon]
MISLLTRFSTVLGRGEVFRKEFLLDTIRTATKKAGGTVKNGRDSIGKRLGVKKFGGEHVIPGNIIIRQRGKTYHTGANVRLGRDYTIYALTEGFVTFRFDRRIKRQVVSVVDENPNPPRYIKQAEAVEN